MAYEFDRTPAHKYLRVNSGPNWYATDFFTVSLWFRLADVTNAHVLLRLNHADSTGANNFYLYARGDVAGDPLQFIVQTAGTSYTVATPTGYSANTWHNVVAIVNRASGNIFISLDGAALTGQASVKFPTTQLNYLQVSGDNAFVPAAIGRIAEVGLWSYLVGFGDSGALQGAAQLAKGFSPRMAQPKNLINYWPLVRGLQDVRGGQALTAYNSPGVGEHCRVLG